jgi:hypothetical protein
MNDPQSPPPLGSEPKKGLSITSLVLGILSIACLSILAGIPAIITGHMARGRAKKEPGLYGGEGFALAGLILGYLSIALALVMIPVMAAMLLPTLVQAKKRAQTIQCVTNLKQIGLAARIWSNDHNDLYPPDFLTMSNELNTPKILVCPGDTTKTKVQVWSQFSPSQNLSYEFLTPNAKEADIVTQTAFHCPIHNNIALGDGSVQQMSGRRR